MYVLHEIPSFQKLGRKNRPNFLQKNNKTPMTKRRSLSLFSCRYTNKRSTKRKMHKTKIPQTNPNPKKNLGLEKNQQEDEGKKKKKKKAEKTVPLPRSFDPLLPVATISECLSLDDGIR